MRVLKIAFVVSAVVGAAACQQQQPKPQAPDLAWLDSLAQAPAAVDTAQAVASPEELNLATAAPAPAPVHHTASRSTSHSSPSRSVSRSSSSSVGSSPGPVARSEPRVTVVKHTKRDAAIGAAAGAVIGAVAGGSHHRVKGGVIGAAVGGILGGVVGNNVDKTHRVGNW